MAINILANVGLSIGALIAGRSLTSLILKAAWNKGIHEMTFCQLRSLLYTVMFDGSAKHSHTITDFAISDWSVEDDAERNPAAITFNGTATVTLRDGPMEDVSLSIKLMKGGAISIWIDPNVVNHFGDTPILGVVLKSRLPFAQAAS